jgi:hypothetical protein
MTRLLGLALLAATTTACTTEPATSPGELMRVVDQALACDDSASDASWACTLELTMDGTAITSVGIHNDGSQSGPRAVGSLSETAVADLDALISTLPLSSESDSAIGCGGAPLAIRSYTIDFETVGLRDLAFHTIEGGAELELKNYVTGLITAIDTCSGNDRISFASCSPRIATNR